MFFFFFFFLIVWKPHLWGMINAFCLFLEACGQLQGGSWSGRNLYLRCRQSRRLEHGNLWYIMMDLQQHFWKYIQIADLSSCKAAVSVFFHQVCCLWVSAGDWGELSDDEEGKKLTAGFLAWNWHFRIQSRAVCSRWERPGEKNIGTSSSRKFVSCFFFFLNAFTKFFSWKEKVKVNVWDPCSLGKPATSHYCCFGFLATSVADCIVAGCRALTRSPHPPTPARRHLTHRQQIRDMRAGLTLSADTRRGNNRSCPRQPTGGEMTLIHHLDAYLLLGSWGICVPITQDTQAKRESHLSVESGRPGHPAAKSTANNCLPRRGCSLRTPAC